MMQDPLDPGTYPARTVSIIDMGVQSQEYNGEKKPPKNELMVTYELLDEFMLDEDGNEIDDKPRWLSETFPLNSLGADLAKSTKRYYALDSEGEHGGDWSELLNIPCMITVTQKTVKDRTYNNIGGVSAMRGKDAKKAAELVNPTRLFTLDSPDKDVFDAMPDWIKDKIKSSLEFDGGFLGDEPKKSKEPEEDSDEEEDEVTW